MPKIGDTFSQYVVVSRSDSGAWLQMRSHPGEIHSKYPNDDYRIELWTWRREKDGDREISREQLCDCCWSYGRPGHIYNAYQWMHCPVCNQQ